MNTTALRAPDWFAEGAMYQINPRTFSAEGTIAAVSRELPQLAEMGFRTMYLCPVFEEDDSCDLSSWSERQKNAQTENPKNPYRMMDYFNIDAEYGTEADLALFIRRAHRLGMRVLLDLVYFHIGPNAYILQTHPEFVRHDENGAVKCTGWHFPELNFESQGLREYLWSNMVYYVGKLDADGFRCDVGDLVPLDFWIEGRRRIQAIKPDAVLLNEGSRYHYLERGFDACYAFAWHEMIYKVFRGEADASALRQCYAKARESLPAGGLLMRDMDNHDTVTDWPERAELAAGHDGMDLILAMNYTLDGIPMVYCGNELADTTELSMFSNRFHRGRFQATDRDALKKTAHGQKREALVKALNALRKDNVLLARGETRWLETEHPEAILAFCRTLEGEVLWFVGNVAKEPQTICWTETGTETVLAEQAEQDGAELRLNGHGWLVLRRQKAGGAER